MGLYSDKDFENFDGYERDGKTEDPLYWSKRNRKNSVGGDELRARISKGKRAQSEQSSKKRRIAIAVTVGILIAAVGGYTVGACTQSDKKAVSQVVNNALAPYSSTLVSENLGRTEGLRYCWYKNDNIGEEIVDSKNDIEEFDLENAFFNVFLQLDYNAYENASEIFNSIKKHADHDDFTAAFGDVTSFYGYAKNLGCVGEKGNFDYDIYVDTMKDRICAKETLKNMADEANNNEVKASNQDNAGKGGK